MSVFSAKNGVHKRDDRDKNEISFGYIVNDSVIEEEGEEVTAADTEDKEALALFPSPLI